MATEEDLSPEDVPFGEHPDCHVHEMPTVKCPIDGCLYETPDVDAVLAAALITTHSTVHARATTSVATAKVEKVKRPTISSAGTSEDWLYFTSRWDDYVEATKVSGADKVVPVMSNSARTSPVPLVAHFLVRQRVRSSQP